MQIDTGVAPPVGGAAGLRQQREQLLHPDAADQIAAAFSQIDNEIVKLRVAR